MRTSSSESVTQFDTPCAKRRRVESNKTSSSGQTIVIDELHTVAVDGKRIFTTEIESPAPATNALSNTSYFSFIVENDAAGEVQNCVFRFTVECQTYGEAVLPTPLWFDRIEWYDRHTGREIARNHGDVMHWLSRTMDQDMQEIFGRAMNYDPKTGSLSTEIQRVGEIKNYYLVMPHLWLEGFNLDLSLLEGDLEIKFYPIGDIRAASGTGVTGYAGAASNFLLREVRWIAASEMSSSLHRLRFKEEKKVFTTQHNFFDVQQFKDTSRVFQANSQYTVDLDQFHHHSAMLLVCLRRDDLKDGGNMLRYATIGKTGTWDHVNVHGRSMLGDGTPIDEEYFRTWVASSVFPTAWCIRNALYVIPFTKDPPSVWRGVIDGFHPFRGDRERLQFVTGPAATDTYNQMINTTVGAGAASAAASRLLYKGQTWFQGDLTATTFQTLTYLVNKCPAVIADNLELTITGTDITLSPGNLANTAGGAGSWVVNYRNRGTSGPIRWDTTKAYIEAATFSAGAGSIQSVAYSAITQGVDGWPLAGVACTVSVYSVYYRHINESMGRLDVQDM